MDFRNVFARVGLCSLLVSLASCTYIIPADPSAPRYNTVVGERRPPERNRPHMNNFRGASMAPMMEAQPPVAQAAIAPAVNTNPAMPTPAPVGDVEARDLPPASVPVPVAQAAVTMPDLPPVDAATRAAAERIDPSIRQIPAENAPYSVATNSFSTVPNYAMPTGSDAPAARLNNVRRDLEDARDATNAAGEQLKRDAAAEPSLQPLPPTAPEQPRRPTGNTPMTVVPPQTAPVTAPAPQTAIPPQATTPQVTYTQPQPGYIALPPPPLMAQAPEPKPVVLTPPVSVTAAPATAPVVAGARTFDPMAVAMANPAPAPIQLRAPSSMLPVTTPIAAPVPVTEPVTAPQVASLSSFNPMAVPATPAVRSGYAGEGFIAPSRYAGHRN